MTAVVGNLPAAMVHSRHLIERLLAVWPEHAAFLTRSFAERDAASLELTEDVAAQVATLAADNLNAYCNAHFCRTMSGCMPRFSRQV